MIFAAAVGELNPQLYHSISLDSMLDMAALPDNAIGKIHMEVSYNSDTEMLTVTVHKIKHLPEHLTKQGLILR